MIAPGMTQTVLTLVGAERTSQDLKWGVQDHDPHAWMAILGEEVGEACKGANSIVYGGATRVREFHYALELLQTAAVAVAAVESLMRSLPDADYDVLCQALEDWHRTIQHRWQREHP